MEERIFFPKDGILVISSEKKMWESVKTRRKSIPAPITRATRIMIAVPFSLPDDFSSS